jgi:hypothetical protein
LKIDETKLKIASVRAKDRHTRQAEVEDAKWLGINEARKANHLAATHAVDAATAKAKLKASQDEIRTAAEEAAKAITERDAAIAVAEANIARAAQAESDTRIAEAAAANSEAGKRAAVAAARRMQLEKAKNSPTRHATNVPQEPGAKSGPANMENTQNLEESGLTRMERKIRAIEEATARMGLPVMCIPTGGKTTLRKECLKSLPQLFGSSGQFDDAWKSAVAQTRVRMANHDEFAAR